MICHNVDGRSVAPLLLYKTTVFLLDTNIVSELRKLRPHGAVVSWLESVPDHELYLSAVTLGEIQAGIEITREQDADKASTIEAWADQVSATYNVLPMDAATFRLWSKLMHRQSNTVYEDAMIAASALMHKLIVATRNVRDFERFDVPVFNPFGK
nr:MULTISPECIES: type II toxin-antitoxin system VapC family toxin [unclassified Mycetohabitans]